MTDRIARRVTHKLFAIAEKAEPAARLFAWIFGMLLALLTIVTVLSDLKPSSGSILAASLVLFLIASLVVFLTDILRMLPQKGDQKKVSEKTGETRATQPPLSPLAEKEVPNELKWPGVSYAYEIVVPLYEMTERRYVAAESRIQQLLAFSVAIMLASVTILVAAQVPLTVSRPFFVATSLLVLQVIVGLTTITFGYLRTLPLEFFVKTALHHSEWEFKKNILYWAVEDLRANRRLVNANGWVVLGMTTLFLTEGAALIWWLFSSLP